MKNARNVRVNCSTLDIPAVIKCSPAAVPWLRHRFHETITAEYVNQKMHARTYGTEKHAQTEYPVNTIIRYSTLIRRDQISRIGAIETTTGIDATMIETIGTGGMIIIIAVEIEIDIEKTRTEAEDLILKVVTEVEDTLVLKGAAEEKVHEAVTDEAQLHNETREAQGEDLPADRLEITTRKDHSLQEVRMHNEKYVSIICEENVRTNNAIEDLIQDLASIGQKENVARESGAHGLISINVHAHHPRLLTLPKITNLRVKDEEKEKEMQKVTENPKVNHHLDRHLLAEARAKTIAKNERSKMVKMVVNQQDRRGEPRPRSRSPKQNVKKDQPMHQLQLIQHT